MRRPRPAARVVVVGGGVTGLTAAARLAADPVDVTVLERDERLGGKILTERRGGFVLEGGPDGFLAAKAAAGDLCDELGVPLVGSRVAGARASVLWDGRLHPLPDGLQGVVPARVRPILASGLFSPAGKARILLGRLRPHPSNEDDESLGSFVRRSLGREAWERLVEPLATGVYAGDGDELSLRAAFPALAPGAPRIRPVASQASRGPMFAAPGPGLDALVDALRARIGEHRVRTATVATAIARADHGYLVGLADGDALRADAVVVATPAPEAAHLIDCLDPALAAGLAAIPHVSTAVVTIAVPTAAVGRREVGHGFVVPRASGNPVVACSVISSKWPGRAPAGWTLVRTFIGRAGQPDPLDRDDPALVNLARDALRMGLAIDAEPAFARVVRWQAAMPQYTIGHLDRIATIRAATADHPGLAVAGNYLRGIGIPDCIATADDAVGAVRRHLDVIGARM